MRGHSEASDARLLYGAWASLTGADSVLSLIFHRYRSMLPEDVQRDVEASYMECRKAAEAIKPRADDLCHTKITHGRHCTCSACAAEDWTDPRLAPCGMHGSSCPREYQPWGLAGTRDWVADSSYGRLNAAGEC